MELTLAGIESDDFAKNDIVTPSFNVAQLQVDGRSKPRWVHFGPGNISRVFLARIAHELIESGDHWPITAVVPRDPDELEIQLQRHDLMTLSVTLNPDGARDMKVIASIAEGLAWRRPEDFERLAEIFVDPHVTMVTLTITEKGYGIRTSSGELASDAREAMDGDPSAFHANTMANIAGLLVRRFNQGGAPINLVSCDNFSHNGDILFDAVSLILERWVERGVVDERILKWITSDQVSFPITVIDKITPRPHPRIAAELSDLGFTDMGITQLGGTPLAGFVNSEPAEYLLIEDVLVGEVPDLAAHGVFIVDRQVCDEFEHMKVTTCLNPLHTALAVSGVLLGFSTIDEEMRDPTLAEMVRRLGWDEGLPVVVDPGIISPEDFLTEVLDVRFPNPYLPDDPRRIAMDTSQKMPIRFGETLKKYMESGRDLGELKVIPLVFALWIRYLLAVDDESVAFELSSDPLAEELTSHLRGMTLGDPGDVHSCVEPILSNPSLFGINLYETPLGQHVERLVYDLVAAPGAVRATIERELK